MKALVTGCSGFLGRHLVEELLSREGVEKVIGLSRRAHPQEVRDPRFLHEWCDVRKCDVLQRVFREFGPDVVFHLAAIPSARLPAGDRGDRLLEVNVLGTNNVLAACPEGTTFVLASSCSVYGETPWGDSACREAWPAAPSSVYAASKLAAEGLVRAYSAQGRVRGKSVRLGALAGKYATHGLLLDVVKKLLSPPQCSPALELFGDEPGSVKPYLHARDAARALCFAAGSPGSLYNAVSDYSLSVADVAAVAQGALGTNKRVVWLGEKTVWPGDDRRVAVDNRLLVDAGWEPEFPDAALAVAAAARELAGVLK